MTTTSDPQSKLNSMRATKRAVGKWRSWETTEGAIRAPNRSMMKALGLSDKDIEAPFVGIASTHNEVTPCNAGIESLVEEVKRGIFAAEGTPFTFGTITVSDAISMGTEGMRGSLVSREVIADSIETVCFAERYDGVVAVAGCDKSLPGSMMAMARLDIPSVFIYGGSIMPGSWRGEDIQIQNVFEAVGEYQAGQIDEEELYQIESHACPGSGACGGMFTANTMASIGEALGLSLPGTASESNVDQRKAASSRAAGHAVMNLLRKNIRPSDILTRKAFENAVTVVVAMGGSTNTVLHLLAAAHEGEVDFTMSDIDKLSRQVPVLCKVAPAKSDVHMEDVHRAGGIMAILGELDRAGLLDTSVGNVHSGTLARALDRWDVARTDAASVHDFYRAAPGGVPTQTAFSQDRRYDAVDLDRSAGVIRDAAHAFSRDGGLAVLYGNLAEDGCIVKTAGVDESILTFTGPAHIFESQDDAVSGILTGKVREGEVVLIRYEGPRGGPGMQEMLYPTSYLKSKGLGKACALVTDGRFSGGSSGLSIGHVSPEAAEGGAIGLVETGDLIEISIPERTINLAVSDDVLAERRTAMEAKGWQPAKPRDRRVSPALEAYAAMTTSAARGAIRDVSQVKQR